MKTLLRLIYSFAIIANCFAALPSTGVWNITTAGSAANGGGFDSTLGGTNYSLQSAAQLVTSDLACAGGGSVVVTSVAAGFTANMLGNIIHINSGTNWTVGYYEITVFTSSSQVSLDRTPTAGAAASVGVANVGGAFTLGTVNDDGFFENGVAGAIYYIKSGTYTLNSQIAVSASFAAGQPAILQGYTTTQGDTCNDTNRPRIESLLLTFLWSNYVMKNVRLTGSPTTTMVTGISYALNCSFINVSTGTGGNAVTCNPASCFEACEFISLRGDAFILGGTQSMVKDCIFRQSNRGIFLGIGTNACSIVGCIFEGNRTGAIVVNAGAGQTGRGLFINNTLFGGIVRKMGGGLDSSAAGSSGIFFQGNIITGFTTGVNNSVSPNTRSNIDNFNTYFNNTTDVNGVGNWAAGANTTTADPGFIGVDEFTGTTATTTAGNHLVQVGANFLGGSNPVVAGRDYLMIISGSGPAVGGYEISSVDSATQITTVQPLVANASTDKTFQIITGHNFNIGPTDKGVAGRGLLPGGLSGSYADPGAAQRLETIPSVSHTFGR